MRELVVISALALGLSAAIPASEARAGGWMEELGAAPAPAGYVQYCETVEDRCVDDRHVGGGHMRLNPTRMTLLKTVNRMVNERMVPAPDEADVWTDRGRKGDCEDFALIKRRALMAEGWRADQLLIAIAETPFGEAHAVLIARTNFGDIVLDSRHDALLRWDETDLRFLARQSAATPAVWARLTEPRPMIEVAMNIRVEDFQPRDVEPIGR